MVSTCSVDHISGKTIVCVILDQSHPPNSYTPHVEVGSRRGPESGRDICTMIAVLHKFQSPQLYVVH